MRDEDKTREQLISELAEIRQRLSELEALEVGRERLQALSRQMVEMQESERYLIARELHDKVGQNLTTLSINLNIVRSQVSAESAARVDARLADTLRLVEETMERTRDVMAELRPPVLDDYGLFAALRWYGESCASRMDLAVTVEGQELDQRLPPFIENVLFRIAQEALTNAAKHAQATRATVALQTDGETAYLVIADDGIGFDSTRPAVPDGGQGWGLAIMRERAEAVGGRFRIESRPRQGTRVIVEVPR